MTFKVKYMLFGKIAILLCLCLVLNNTFMIKSYADESIAAQNTLFIPINTFVTAVLIGSGMIAKNSQDALDAGGKLVNDIISQIKSSEVAKSEANPDYDSPFRVINGGKSEKPNNDNKDGKWVASAAGALAAHEIYASKDAIKDIMSKANSLGGYKQSTLETGVVSIADSKILSVANASGIALQLANFSNKLVTQFNEIIHSDAYKNWLSKNNLDESHIVYSVIFDVQSLLSKQNYYPLVSVSAIDLTNVENIRLEYQMVRETFSYEEDSNYYSGSFVFDTPSTMTNTDYYGIFNPLNSDLESINCPIGFFYAPQRTSDATPSVKPYFSYKFSQYYAFSYSSVGLNTRGYAGYKWLNVNPIQFTNNVYNVNMSFDENFQNWLQGQIQGIGGQLIDAVRLGLTSVSPSWNPNQEQIQAGTSPDNVIYQFINNYENPENIPDDTQPDPEPSPEPTPEPVPDNEYLGNFLLPESITTKFPFCIPFDVARCLRLFSTSDREAPRWECDLGYGSNTYHVVIDLSMFNDVANFIRPLEYIVFLVGLAIATRSLIRG